MKPSAHAAASLILITVAMIMSASAAKACVDLRNCGGVKKNPRGFGVTITAYHADGQPETLSVGDGAEPGVKYVWSMVPNCPGNSPSQPGDARSCVGANTSCSIPGDLQWSVYYRNLAVQPPNWIYLRASCLGPRPMLDIAAVHAEVNRIFRRQLPLPGGSLRVQPPNGALVNFPTIFYTDAAADLRFTVTALGLRVQVVAHPERYHWRFGDGSELTTTLPGRPHPAKDVTHTYSTSTDGVAAQVSIEWSGTYRIAGIPEEFDVEGTVVRDGPPVTFAVRQARAELVAEQ